METATNPGAQRVDQGLLGQFLGQVDVIEQAGQDGHHFWDSIR